MNVGFQTSIKTANIYIIIGFSHKRHGSHIQCYLVDSAETDFII